MAMLELTDEEHALLVQILTGYLSDLRMEIVDTDRADYKEDLRQRKSAIERMLEKMGRISTAG